MATKTQPKPTKKCIGCGRVNNKGTYKYRYCLVETECALLRRRVYDRIRYQDRQNNPQTKAYRKAYYRDYYKDPKHKELNRIRARNYYRRIREQKTTFQ